MAAATLLENIIGSEVRKPPNGGWGAEVSQKLAADIAAKVDPLKLNIRLIQEGDNMYRIVEGLSGRALKLKVEGGDGRIENLPVNYLGNSEQIRKAICGNPLGLLRSAHVIQAGQYVAVDRHLTQVYVADSLDQIRNTL